MKNERNFFDTKQNDDASASEYANVSTHAEGSMKPERDEHGGGMSNIKANRLMRINSAATAAKRMPKKKFTTKSKSGAVKPAAANKKQDKKRLFKAAEQTQARKHSNAKSSESPVFAKKSTYERGEFSAKHRSMRRKIHNPADSNTSQDGENTSASKLPARRKKPLVICGIIAVAAAFFVFLYLYTIVDEITVEGCLTYNQTEILKKADLFTGDNILSYDLNSISESIGMIPELTVLQIDRVFPNKIRIVVFERTAGAAIADIGGSYTIIDDDGYVLRIGVSEPDPGLPVVVGMFTTGFTINTKITQTGVDVRTTSLIELISALRASDIYERIISIDISNPANVKLNASNGFTVMLGQAVDLKAKAERLAKALEIVERDYPMGGTIYIGDSDTIDFHPNLLPAEPSPGVNVSTSPDASAMPETPEPSPGVNVSTSPDASAMPETPEPSVAPAAPDETPAP